MSATATEPAFGTTSSWAPAQTETAVARPSRVSVDGAGIRGVVRATNSHWQPHLYEEVEHCKLRASDGGHLRVYPTQLVVRVSLRTSQGERAA